MCTGVCGRERQAWRFSPSHRWQVAEELVGGLTNCPRCGKATQIEGLRDPFWRVIQVGAVVVWVLAVAAIYAQGGLGWAVIGGVALAGLYAFISALL